LSTKSTLLVHVAILLSSYQGGSNVTAPDHMAAIV